MRQTLVGVQRDAAAQVRKVVKMTVKRMLKGALKAVLKGVLWHLIRGVEMLQKEAVNGASRRRRFKARKVKEDERKTFYWKR